MTRRDWILLGLLATLVLAVIYDGWQTRKELERQAIARGNLLDAAELRKALDDLRDLEARFRVVESEVEEITPRVPCDGCVESIWSDLKDLEALHRAKGEL